MSLFFRTQSNRIWRIESLLLYGLVAQLARALLLHSRGSGFNSRRVHQKNFVRVFLPTQKGLSFLLGHPRV